MSGMFLGMLAGASVRAPLAAALVAGALAVLRVRASAVRHASWTAVLFAMLLMPVLSYGVPAVRVPLSGFAPALPGGITALGASQTVRRVERAPESGRTASANPVAVRVHDSGTADDGASSNRPVPLDPPSQAAGWLLTVLTVYCIVAAAMLVRFVVGWCGAAGIARRSEPIDPARESLAFIKSRREVDIRQSRWIAAPVTVGILAPTILLPVAWRRWSREKLRAVLAHEMAHVERRDLLVALVAHLNRCLFWFHPLSWWLERTLAATAEQASDDVAMSVVGERAAYAEILVDMARAVSRRRGRISWLGVGIDGSGLLNQRIERVLSGAVLQETSAVCKSLLALSCMTAILLAVACQPSSASFRASATFEQRDRALRAELEQVEGNGWRDFANVDWNADPRSVESREAAVRQDPEDLVALQQFLVSYWVQYACKPVAGCGNPLVAAKAVDSNLLASRRAHILWLIEHHPESDLAGAGEARIFPDDLQPFFPGDPLGYSQAKALWLAQAHQPNVTAVVLGHAADFLEVADKPLAEQFLLRARAMDPSGPWTARLGWFYTSVLVGTVARDGRNSIRTLSVGEPRSPFGIVVREKLGESTDEILLTATGWFLSSSGGRPWMNFDPNAWAESCFRRALQINPAGVLAHSALLRVVSDQRANREPLWRLSPASLDFRVAALPDADRFEELPGLARDAYQTVAGLERWNDDPNLRGRRELARDQAKKYAEEALRLAPKFRDHPHYGAAIYTANMTLSALALHDGDKTKALAYLQRASRAPASEELTYADDVVSRWRVVRDLVAQGERKAVVDFLERMAQTNLAERMDLREASAALRRGETPRGFRTTWGPGRL
jgi:hypothetical protein